MRIVTLCLALFVLVALLAGAAPPSAASGPPIGEPLEPPKWLGNRIDGTLVVAASGGPSYLLSGYTLCAEAEDLPEQWEAPDLSPRDDRLAFHLGMVNDDRPWLTYAHIWTADEDGTNSEQVTSCGPGGIAGGLRTFEGKRLVREGRLNVVNPMLTKDLPELTEPRSDGGPTPKMQTPNVVRDTKIVRVPLHYYGPGPLPRPPLPDEPPCINCMALWSPDASMIAYNRCDSTARVHHVVADPNAPGLCDDPGFSYWIANADGTNPRRVSELPAEPQVFGMGWSPDGSMLLYSAANGSLTKAVIVNRANNYSKGELQHVGWAPSWSPDGSCVVSVFAEEATSADGVPAGVWVRLRLTDVATDTIIDPDHPLWEQFVPADWLGMGGDTGLTVPHEDREYLLLRTCHLPKWSPTGGSIAFLGLDWDALAHAGASVHSQVVDDPYGFLCDYVEVHLLEVYSGRCWQLTNDERYEHQLRFTGPNTLPSYPHIDVGTVAVSFLDVSSAGRTSVMWQENPPALPWGYRALSEVYHLQTTAKYSGSYVISMDHTMANLNAELLGRVRIMRYNAANSTWEPTAPDTESAPEAGVARTIIDSGGPSLEKAALFVVALTPAD